MAESFPVSPEQGLVTGRSSGVFPTSAARRFLTVPDIARLLEISQETARRMCARKQLPAVRVGARWKVPIALLTRRHRLLAGIARAAEKEALKKDTF